MSQKWTEGLLLSYISDGVEESHALEYKSAGALGRQNNQMVEITKDVSAFANSAGGVIVYGLSERGHIPERLDPIDRNNFSREWLEQIISRIQPRPTVYIHSVQLSSAAEHVAYVVEVPQGTTAHQAADLRYYKRQNFQSTPMPDHEVRDVMGRRSTPVVDTEVRIYLGKHDVQNRVFWKVRNQSNVMVRYVSSTLEIPVLVQDRYVHFSRGDSVNDEQGYGWWQLRPSNHADRPLFPKSEMKREFYFTFQVLRQILGRPLKALPSVRYETYADSMEPRRGTIDLASIVKRSELVL